MPAWQFNSTEKSCASEKLREIKPIQSERIPPSSDSVELASKTLFELWGTPLADYELNPPITPVTNQVLHLNSKI
ncbi:GL15681 [Drosophila persimilis]|uniref:GL15681 n=1 Tax=Drosophila persimilis TaxID=7234 RepID=B4H917_DROPE|nr:GL15681 [Drosophila persimilis]